jgi:hypothetical protein
MCPETAELQIGPEPWQQIVRYRRDRVVTTKTLVKSLFLVAHCVLLKCGDIGAEAFYHRRASLERVRLLNPDRITTADCAAAHYGSIYPDVDLVMLGRRAQDSRIPREIPLRESGHHTTPATRD